MVSVSAGVLLGASLLHLLPEALDKGMDHHNLFALLLAGLLFFFVLEKFSIFATAITTSTMDTIITTSPTAHREAETAKAHRG